MDGLSINSLCRVSLICFPGRNKNLECCSSQRGTGRKKPLEQHQIKPICNARSGNQTGTLSPLRHPCPPPWGNTLRRFFPPPPLAPGNNLPNNLRILPTDFTLKHHAPDVNLNATSGHYLLDFSPDLILRTFRTDIPDEHSPQLTPSLP